MELIDEIAKSDSLLRKVELAQSMNSSSATPRSEWALAAVAIASRLCECWSDAPAFPCEPQFNLLKLDARNRAKNLFSSLSNSP